MAPQRHACAVIPSGRPARELSTLFRLCSAGDTRARETIVVRFLPLACRLARIYEGRGEPIEDLRQAASLGLIKAVDRFSFDRGDSFPAYARPVILGEIRRHFRDTTWRVHVPRPIKDRAAQVLLADRELSTAPGSASRARPDRRPPRSRVRGGCRGATCDRGAVAPITRRAEFRLRRPQAHAWRGDRWRGARVRKGRGLARGRKRAAQTRPARREGPVVAAGLRADARRDRRSRRCLSGACLEDPSQRGPSVDGVVRTGCRHVIVPADGCSVCSPS